MLRRTGTVLFFFTNYGPCVYFTVVMKIFSHLLGTKATQMPIVITEKNGILYLAKSTVNGMKSFSIHKKIHCIVLKSGLNFFINMGTFQSEIVILVRDTHYMVLISLQ